ncbi:MAG: hypothetical protein ABIT10_06405 [Alteraurantiacibacter sp.]
MDFGGPTFVLAIIGMAMFAGVFKSAIRARHGIDDSRSRGRQRRDAQPSMQDADALAALKLENRQLREKLELHENRLISLERIVTDPGYDVARQIEQLRDTTPLPAFTRDRTTA